MCWVNWYLRLLPTIVVSASQPLNEVASTSVTRVKTTGFDLSEIPPITILMKVNHYTAVIITWVDVIMRLKS